MNRNRGKYITLVASAVILLTLLISPIYSSSPLNFFEESGEEIRTLSQGPWPSFGRDKSNTRLSPYNTSHIDGTLNWSREVGLAIRSSPAIGSNDVLYYGGYDNTLYAVDVDDGEEKWSYTTGGIIISSPAVSEDETIYFGSGDNHIYALNPDGTLKWRYETGEVVYSSPTVDEDGNVYVGSYDGNLYSINEDGELNWKFSSRSWLWSSPSISEEGIVYVGSGDNNLYAIDKTDGAELWNYSTGGYIYSSPAIGENGIYFGSYDGTLYALDRDGDLKWNFDSDSRIHSSPAVDQEGTIYFGSRDGEMYAVRDGLKLWSFETSDGIRSSPAVSADGYIYFGSSDGFIYSLNSVGEKVWSYETDRGVYSSPAIGEDGKIFVGSLDGVMHSFTGTDNDLDLDIEIWREVEISVKMSGRINNRLSVVLEKDDDVLENMELIREPGKPQTDTITIRYKELNDYTLNLEYLSEEKGSNPVWIKFSSGNRSNTIFENFNYYHEQGHEKSYDINEEIDDMVSKVREIHFSISGELDIDEISSSEWNFGDGNTSEGVYVVHRYSSSGVYNITLNVFYEDGTIISLEDIVIIDDSLDESWHRSYYSAASNAYSRRGYLDLRPI